MNLTFSISYELLLKLVESKGFKVEKHSFKMNEEPVDAVRIGGYWYRLKNAIELLFPEGSDFEEVKGELNINSIPEERASLLFKTSIMIWEQAKSNPDQFQGLFWGIVIENFDKVFTKIPNPEQ